VTTMVKRQFRSRGSLAGVAAMLGLWACSAAFAADDAKAAATAARPAATDAKALKNRTIGYVLTDLMWANYETPGGKTECPQGLNTLGPREQFEILYPKNKPRKLIDTELKFESGTWYPTTEPDQFPFHEAVGPAYGLNLDGKVGPKDFTDPDGNPGIDNQLYRAIGCLVGFRKDGLQYIFLKMAITKERYTRLMIELSDVDDLVNDPHVKVTIYRGIDRLLTDATGEKVVPGGSQRIDIRWGKEFMQQLDGEIVNGVLTTKPVAQMLIPWDSNTATPTEQLIHDMRLRLKISPTGAQGLIGGYADVETFYKANIRSDSTHHLSNGQVSAPSLYRVLRRLADAYPDPATGANTAISSALSAKFTQVYIEHPLGEEAKAALLRSLAQRAATQAVAQTSATPGSGGQQNAGH
jgi:hypothetical protein